MSHFSKKLADGENIVIKAKLSSSRKIPLILGFVIFLGTFAYSYMWSSKWHDNVWDGLSLGYFQPFFIGAAISLLLLAYYVLFCRCKLTLTDKRIIGKAKSFGNICIPLGTIEKASSLKNNVSIVADGTEYCFFYILNAKDVVASINNLPKTKTEEKVIRSKSSTKKVILVLVAIALILIFYVCSSEGLFSSSGSSSSSKSWSELSDVEKENAKWAYEAKQYIDSKK